MSTLINRLKPFPLESLSSLLERLRSVNYYEEPSWYRSLLSPVLPVNPDYIYSPAHFTELSRLSGLSIPELQSLTVHRFLPILSGDRNRDKRQLGENNSTSNNTEWRLKYVDSYQCTRFCLYCWSERQILLVPWRIKYVTTCPIHRVLLADKCTCCGKTLRINQEKGLCRNCKQPVSEIEPFSIAAHEESVSLSVQIWKTLGCNEIPLPVKATLGDKKHPIHSVSRSALLAFLWHSSWLLGDIIRGRIHDRTCILPLGLSDEGFRGNLFSATTAQIHCALVKVWQLLLYWPQEWFEVLNILLCNRFEVDNTASAIDILSKYRGAEWNWFWEGWPDFLRDVMGMHTFFQYDMGSSRVYSLGENFTLPNLFSHRAASFRLGIAQTHIEDFIASGDLVTVRRPRQNSSWAWSLITADSVEQLLSRIGRYKNISGMEALLGLSSRYIIAFVEAGVLSPEENSLSGGCDSWLFDWVASCTLISRFMELFEIRPFPRPYYYGRRFGILNFETLCFLETYLKRTYTQIIKDIRDGKLEMFRPCDTRDVNKLWCEPEAVDAYISLVRSEQGE